jgi:MFS family permease
LVAGGLASAIHALRGILPTGSLKARTGLPAIVAAGFLLNFAFYGAATFVPLVLTGVRGTSLTKVGIVVSAGTISWSLAVWLNTQLVDRYPRWRLIAGAGVLLAIGILGFGATIVGLPLAIAYAAWIAAGMGMGIAFNTFTLNVMLFARKGAEGAALAARNLSGSLGTAMGSGVGGAALAVSTAANAGIRPGLGLIYLLAAAAAAGTAALAGRSSRQ